MTIMENEKCYKITTVLWQLCCGQCFEKTVNHTSNSQLRLSLSNVPFFGNWKILNEGCAIVLIQKNLIFLPDFRFSGGLMTRDLERLTLSDLRLTSRRKVVAFSCIRWMGRLVGVTQYCAANILTSFRTHCFRTSIKIHQSTFSITVNFFLSLIQ